MAWQITKETAKHLAFKHYSIEGELTALSSYADVNFLLKAEKQKYILKFNKENVRFETDLMAFLTKMPNTPVPKIYKNNKDELISEIYLKNSKYFMRLIGFIEGEMLFSVKRPSVSLLESFGRELARLDLTMRNFSHPGQNRYLAWDAKHSLNIIESKKKYLVKSERDLLDYHLENFKKHSSAALATLRRQLIHNDANDQNIIVAKDEQAVVGIIDFGDAVKSFLISEPANACAYLMMDRERPLDLAPVFVRAYHRILPLKENELELLFDMIILRLCLSVSMSGFARQTIADNEYLTVSERPAWALLDYFKEMTVQEKKNYFKERVL